MGTQSVKTKLAVVDLATETQNHIFNLDDLISKLTRATWKNKLPCFQE